MIIKYTSVTNGCFLVKIYLIGAVMIAELAIHLGGCSSRVIEEVFRLWKSVLF